MLGSAVQRHAVLACAVMHVGLTVVSVLVRWCPPSPGSEQRASCASAYGLSLKLSSHVRPPSVFSSSCCTDPTMYLALGNIAQHSIAGHGRVNNGAGHNRTEQVLPARPVRVFGAVQ
jgi:hypothetical protein